MLGALIIVFREVIEAGLIVGIVMAATRGVPTRGRWIGHRRGAGRLDGSTPATGRAGLIRRRARPSLSEQGESRCP